MIVSKIQFANISIRGLSILLRFLLVFGVGKFYALDSLGVYGLFNTSVTILIFFFGFDFYNYFHRDLLRSSKEGQLVILSNSLIFYALSYIVFIPLTYLLFLTKTLSFSLILWFYLILILEHLSQEVYRLFIVLERQLFANFLLFIRSAAWVIIVVANWYLNNFQSLTLQIIWVSWSLGAGTSLLIGCLALVKKYNGINFKWTTDFGWIWQGAKISAKFLVGTLAYKIIEFSDRYFIKFYLSDESLGIYTLFYNFSNILQTVVFTLVIADIYPILIRLYEKKEIKEYCSVKNRFSKQVVLYSLAGGVIICVGILPLLSLMGRPELFEEFFTYSLLVGAVTILNLSFIPHYFLYAQRHDNVIMYCTLLGATVNVAGNVLLVPIMGLQGCAISAIVGYTTIWLSKYGSYRFIVQTA